LRLLWADLYQGCFLRNAIKFENPIKSDKIFNPYPNNWIGFKIQKTGFGCKTNPLKLI